MALMASAASMGMSGLGVDDSVGEREDMGEVRDRLRRMLQSEEALRLLGLLLHYLYWAVLRAAIGGGIGVPRVICSAAVVACLHGSTQQRAPRQQAARRLRQAAAQLELH